MSGRVLVARLDNLGDVLLAGPAVRAVRASGLAVTMLCGPNGRAAAELLPGVDEILEFRAPWIDPDGHAVDGAAIDALVDDVRARRFQQAAVLTSFHQSPLPLALLLRLAGVPMIAAISVDYPGTLLDVRHLVADDLHEVERNLSLVATLGHRLAPGDDGRLAVELPGGDIPAELHRPVRRRAPRRIGPGSGVDGRRSPRRRRRTARGRLARRRHRRTQRTRPDRRRRRSTGCRRSRRAHDVRRARHRARRRRDRRRRQHGRGAPRRCRRNSGRVGVRPDRPGKQVATVATAPCAARRPGDRLRRLSRPSVSRRRSPVRRRCHLR